MGDIGNGVDKAPLSCMSHRWLPAAAFSVFLLTHHEDLKKDFQNCCLHLKSNRVDRFNMHREDKGDGNLLTGIKGDVFFTLINF